ncbi:hypothetical protein CW751_12645 [Brumimicrobium salinarum]|uniref:Uncharacterized protein n=1 Tax=Brumimicrobium salinarum TaxID=2058658 RepID=A0A2I0R059_9FLAO|nr:type IX secretion system membrane protein PorP/SprF [Brumimicrobium salinarum]PKR79925.1 hypothetical protein CW751_12645 [Brumimicrobium salinarum]
MSRPSFENIDQWLFEYTEGNLSVEQETQLMDFIRLNPEVVSDLKAWNQAKVKPLDTSGFSAAGLMRPTPFFMRPVTLIALGGIILMLSLVGLEFYPVTPQYSKSEIDIDQITTNETDFVTPKFTTKNKKNIKPIIQKRKVNDFSKSIQSRSVQKNDNRAIETDFNNLAAQGELKIVDQTSEKDRLEIVKNTEKTVGDISTALTTNINAPDLNKIKDYLSGKTDIESNDVAEERSQKVKVISTKGSFKKSIKSTLRKIKRMANQPVALRNTKNPNFHAPMMNGFAANSAMVGSAPGNRIQNTTRLQWYEQKNAQLKNAISWDGYVYGLRGGLGIDASFNTYNKNDINNYQVAITYSPKFSISSKVSFEPALRFKMGVINLDTESDLISSRIELNRHQLIPLFEDKNQVNGNQLWYRDIGLGFMLNTEWFYLGFEADNLGRHNNNFYSSDLSKNYKSNIHYTAVFGTEYQFFNRDIRISGYGLYQNNGYLNELWLGGNAQFNWLQFGAGINTQADVGVSLGTIFKQFSIHYNLDYLQSQLMEKKLLSHQVSIKLMLKPSRLTSKFLNL